MIKKIFPAMKILGLRFSAFLFDMIALSFFITLFLIIVIDTLKLDIKAVEVMRSQAYDDSVVKSITYLFFIGFYYFVHLLLKKNTFGMFLTHLSFARKPAVAKKGKENSEVVPKSDEVKESAGVKVKFIGFLSRMGDVFIFCSIQMINVFLLGLFTVIHAFGKSELPLQEKYSGILIVGKKSLSKM